MPPAAHTTEIVSAEPAAPSFLSAPTSAALPVAIAKNPEATAALAGIYIAKQFPRDLAAITADMSSVCSRIRLAQSAAYAYPRGGTTVYGPSIRLAEALQGVWGNIESGWKHLGVSYDEKKKIHVSKCVAFCWDKQTNNRASMEFTVPHWRDTQSGGYEIKSEREVYELCANMAARRKRAVIFQILPAWLVEEAMDICRRTMDEYNGSRPLEDLIRTMEADFLKIGITRAMLETKLGHTIAATTYKEITELGNAYNALKEGIVKPDDIFPEPAAPEQPQPGQEPPKKKRRTAAPETAAELPTFGTPA